MSNYDNDQDKIKARLSELERKHKALDNEIQMRYNNVTIDEQVRRMKTMKLYLKDEIYRLNAQLVQAKLR
jgi:hypothetical protein